MKRTRMMRPITRREAHKKNLEPEYEAHKNDETHHKNIILIRSIYEIS